MGALLDHFFALLFLTQVERFSHLEIMASSSSHGFSSRGDSFSSSSSNDNGL